MTRKRNYRDRIGRKREERRTRLQVLEASAPSNSTRASLQKPSIKPAVNLVARSQLLSSSDVDRLCLFQICRSAELRCVR
jgi:hypothetical protein